MENFSHCERQVTKDEEVVIKRPGQLQYEYQQGFRVTSRTPDTIGDLDLSVFDKRWSHTEYRIYSRRIILCAAGHSDCMNLH